MRADARITARDVLEVWCGTHDVRVIGQLTQLADDLDARRFRLSFDKMACPTGGECEEAWHARAAR